MIYRGLLLAICVSLGLSLGCGEDVEPEPETKPLEIGIRDAEGNFHLIQPDEVVAVVLGANGLNMVVPSLRATGINPRGPDPTIQLSVAGILMAADIEGSRVDMQDTEAGYVLWDLRVPFQTDLCCYVCRPGIMTAQLRDASGQIFSGQVSIQLERGGCPDPDACCAEASACPDPTLTLVCE